MHREYGIFSTLICVSFINVKPAANVLLLQFVEICLHFDMNFDDITVKKFFLKSHIGMKTFYRYCIQTEDAP